MGSLSRMRKAALVVTAALAVCALVQWESCGASPPRLHAEPTVAATAGILRGGHANREGLQAVNSDAPVPAPPPGVPRSCAALHAFWTPHIEWGLRYWGPGMIRVRDVLTPPHTTHPAPLVVQVLSDAVHARAIPGTHQYPGRAPATLWEVARVVEELRLMLEADRKQSASGVHREDAAAPSNPTTALLPDLVFRVYGEDFPSMGTPGERAHAPVDLLAPSLCASVDSHALCTAAPDWSTGWWDSNGAGDERGMDYQEQLERIFAAADARPYHTRIGRAVTRGDLRHPDRSLAKEAFLALDPSLLDVGQNFTAIEETLQFNASRAAALGQAYDASAAALAAHSEALRSVSNTDFMSPAVHYAAYKVQLSIAGNGYTARLKYLLATGSPTIVMMSTLRGSMEEFFIRAMTPFVHYVPVYSGPMVVRATQWLLAHPQEAAAIGAAGRAFVTQYLSRPALNCWWASFFHAYASRSALDDDARHVRLPLSVHMPPPEPIAGQPRSNRTSQKLAIAAFELALEVVEAAVRSAADGVRIEGATGDDAAFAQLKALSADDRMKRLAATLGDGVTGRSPYVSGGAVLAAASRLQQFVLHEDSLLRQCVGGHPLLHVPPAWVDDTAGRGRDNWPDAIRDAAAIGARMLQQQASACEAGRAP